MIIIVLFIVFILLTALIGILWIWFDMQDKKYPHSSGYSYSEDFQNHLAELRGIAKRRNYLDRELSGIKSAIKAKQESAFSDAIKLGMAIRTSAYKENTADWAILGGVASGIAGPAAGLAVAANTMRENSEIEARNRKRQEEANRLSTQIVSAAMDAPVDTSAFQKEKEKIVKEIGELSSKQILNSIKQETIWNALKITQIEIKQTHAEGPLDVHIAVKNQLFLNDVPKDIKYVVDGSLKAEIYAGKMFVGSIYIPLPKYGIECGKEETVSAICKMYSTNGQEYTAEISPNKLWVMEL